MPRKIAAKPASPLHRDLLLRLRRLWAEHGLTNKAGMEKAGLSEQLYNQWQHGQSPRLATLERIAAVYEVSVYELIGGVAGGLLSEQSAVIAGAIDALPEEARTAIARSVQAQAMLYRSGVVRAADAK